MAVTDLEWVVCRLCSWASAILISDGSDFDSFRESLWDGIAPPSRAIDQLGRLRSHGECLGALLLIVDGRRLISDG
jgi:hypothetical protein